MIKHAFSISLTLFLFVLSGCANVNHSYKNEIDEKEAAEKEFTKIDVSEDTQQNAISDYIIQRGDVIDVKFYYRPELNENLRVRPDGKIALQLISETLAAGLTPSELTEILIEKYSKLFHQLEVVVIVQDFAGYKIYVGGEVNVPGVVTNFGNLGALEAIFMAGGFKATAYPGSVVIIRKGPDNHPYVKKLNLTEVMSGEALEENILLKPYDVIYVPKSAIAKANLFVEQYITGMIPGHLSSGFSYVINDVRDSSKTNVFLPGGP